MIKQKAEQERKIFNRIENHAIDNDTAGLLELYRQLSSNGKAAVLERLRILLINQKGEV